MKPILLLVIAALAMDARAQTNTAADTNSIAARRARMLRNAATNFPTLPSPTIPLPTVRTGMVASGAATNIAPAINTTVVNPTVVAPVPATTAAQTIGPNPPPSNPPNAFGQVPTRTLPQFNNVPPPGG